MDNQNVKKENGEISQSGLLIQNISIKPINRQSLDIQNWRNRHQQAEGINGNRIALYNMYSDALLDGFLKRLCLKRVLSVTKNRLRYVDKKGVEVPGATNFIQLRQFRRLRREIQLQKAWGISVIELMNDKGQFRFFSVPRKNILPKEGKILFNENGTDGIEYRKPPYNKTVIEIGDWDDLGYLLEACCYVIYKRGNIADWANYAQIFGMPFREARYDGFNEVVRMQLENALEKAGSAAFAVLPRDAELTFHEMKNSSGASELYDTFRRAMNEEMSVCIIGATETVTSSSSSGLAQSKTHMVTVDEVTQDDKEDELSVLNDQVLDVLVSLGFLPDGGKFIYNEPINIDIAMKRVEIALTVKEMGTPVSDDYFYKISGIPKPANYNELKAANEMVYDVENSIDDNSEMPASKKSKLLAILKNWFKNNSEDTE